jgi:hypothetical protein
MRSRDESVKAMTRACVALHSEMQKPKVVTWVPEMGPLSKLEREIVRTAVAEQITFECDMRSRFR